MACCVIITEIQRTPFRNQSPIACVNVASDSVIFIDTPVVLNNYYYYILFYVLGSGKGKERKHLALRPQKPLRLIRDGEVGGQGFYI